MEYWSKFAYNLSNLDTSNKKLEKWYEEALGFLLSGEPGDFIYARYGYAVEELMNTELEASLFCLGSDYRILLQATFGYTRPDIVIYKQFADYAWIDITSENCIGHIFNKAGSGWQNTPIVCEVLYPELNLSSISFTGSETIADRTAAVRALRRRHEKERKVCGYMIWNIDRSVAYILSVSSSRELTQKDIAGIIERNFGYNFRGNYKYPVIHSMLILYMEKGGGNYYEYVRNWLLPLFSSSSRNKSAAVDYIYRSYENAKLYC